MLHNEYNCVASHLYEFHVSTLNCGKALTTVLRCLGRFP
uniref:Uncharacterized protein n=1 Tax=Anguilla anguilla TaxID=7936 RepID=A0A0E9QRJ3_ANGAN